jgi:hypothetical protein
MVVCRILMLGIDELRWAVATAARNRRAQVSYRHVRSGGDELR